MSLLSVNAEPVPGVVVPIAPIGGAAIYGERTYLCDPRNHCVDVVDADGRPLFSFGGRGSRLGQLNTPTDIAVIWLAQGDEGDEETGVPMIAVADRGNHRIQLFEPDGVAIVAIDGREGQAALSPWAPRAGWPFFRLATSVPRFALPSRLQWRAPYLEVACAATGAVRFDLAAALLPEFTAWLDAAPSRTLQAALEAFTAEPYSENVPDACLLAIVERLQSSYDARMFARTRGCA